MRFRHLLDILIGTKKLKCYREGACSHRSGVAALEFALILPLLFSMLAGLYDLTTGYIASLRANYCAQAIDEIVTSEAAGSVTVNTLKQSQVTSAASAAYAYLPRLLSASPPTFGIVISAIAMTPIIPGCTSGCTYTAHVAWSGSYQGTLGIVRPCDLVKGVSVITQTTDSAAPSPTTLPSDLFSAASLMVVDVTYTYTPLFFKFLTSSFTIRQSAYFAPRAGVTNSWIHYIYAAPDSTALCSGYPSG
jgi:Flp pilus assembly protein TadG